MYGLIKLHRQIEGEAKRAKKNLAHVRAVIKIVSPDFDVSTIKPKKPYRVNPWFERGEVFREALAVLREAGKPLSQTDIVRHMLAKRGVPEPSPAALKDMRNAIHATLPRYEGKVIKSTGKREARRWSLLD
ncbi:MAG TPA: hypothetical protein VGM66_01225 [Candidatus Udaeobacter sp.]|jgi:hypothetical protein